jgi:hypothetical protein
VHFQSLSLSAQPTPCWSLISTKYKDYPPTSNLVSLMMSSIEPKGFDCLLLEPFPLRNQRIHVLELAGGGNADDVFKVLIGDNTYALKMVSKM